MASYFLYRSESVANLVKGDTDPKSGEVIPSGPRTTATKPLIVDGNYQEVVVDDNTEFPNSGELQFVHGDGTVSIWEYTAKLNKIFANIEFVSGSLTPIAGGDVITPYPDAVLEHNTFRATTPAWEVTDAYLESVEPAASSFPDGIDTAFIKSIIHPKLKLGIFTRDQITATGDSVQPVRSFGAFNSGSSESSVNITFPFVRDVKLSDVSRSIIKQSIHDIEIYSGPHLDRLKIIGSVEIPFFSIGSHGTAITFFENFRSVVNPPVVENAGADQTVIDINVGLNLYIDTVSRYENGEKIVNPASVTLFLDGDGGDLEQQEVNDLEVNSTICPTENAGLDKTIIDINIGSNLLVDSVSRFESGQQIVNKATTSLLVASYGNFEQHTINDLEVNSTISTTDEKLANIISFGSDITVGVNYNEVESQSTTFVKALTYEKADINYEYQVKVPKQRTLVNTDIATLLQDIDTISTTFVLIVTGGAEEIGGSGATFPYNRGLVDYQIERYVLSRFIRKRDGNNYTLDQYSYNIIDRRDGTQFEVENLSVFSPDNLDNYTLGNAGLTLKTFENNIFVDFGVGEGNTLDNIERIYGNQIRIEDFDPTIRGNSAVLQDGVRFQMGIPTIQSPVTKSSGSLVGGTLTVQSTVYFEESGKLLLAHGDSTTSVYEYTGKTGSAFTGLSFYSGSGTSISANDEIIPFQIV